MGRYIGPDTKIAKKFNDVSFSKKFALKKNKSKLNLKRKARKTEYGELLTSKVKILYLYNIREKQLKNYVKESMRKLENSENVLSHLLETRLDNVVYRLGMGKTRKACRQLVSHGHICVNGNIINIASFLVKVGDSISYSEKDKKNANIVSNIDDSLNIFNWLKWNQDKKSGEILAIPTPQDIPERIKIKDVIEIYAR